MKRRAKKEKFGENKKKVTKIGREVSRELKKR